MDLGHFKSTRPWPAFDNVKNREMKSESGFSLAMASQLFGKGICHSHSRSRKLEMEFVIPVPVPEVQKSFPFTPGGNPVLV